jgi:predicted SAM-dependent methyltransferase
MMDGPAFLGLGAHRAGMCWLYQHLARHPEVHFPPELKEVFFWSIRAAKGDDWYSERFTAPSKIQGDVNSAYATAPSQLIHHYYRNWPDLKLIYIARDPIERSWSMVRQKTRDFRLNHEILSDAWFIGHFEHPENSARSDAVTCVENWLRFYPPESLLILDYEDIKNRPRQLLRKIFAHLGAPANHVDSIPDADLKSPVNAGPSIPLRPYLREYLGQMYAKVRGFQRSTDEGLAILQLAPPSRNDFSDRPYVRDFEKNWFHPGEPKKLHIGCGGKLLPGWINTREKARPSDNICSLDPNRPLRIADELFDRVFINGLPSAPGRALRLLTECHRILRPGGRLRVRTLNLDFLVQLYKNQSERDIQRYIVWYTESFLPNSDYYSGASVANDLMRKAINDAAYDSVSLLELLEEAGFPAPKVMAAGQAGHLEFDGVEDELRVPTGLLKLESIAAEVERIA